MKTFKAFMKPFETMQRSGEIKIYVYFFSSFGIETGRIDSNHRFPVNTNITEQLPSNQFHGVGVFL